MSVLSRYSVHLLEVLRSLFQCAFALEKSIISKWISRGRCGCPKLYKPLQALHVWHVRRSSLRGTGLKPNSLSHA